MALKKNTDDHQMPRTPLRHVTLVIVLVAIPIAFFVLLEVGLRIAGLHEEYPLFVPSPANANYLQASPDVIRRLFSDPDAAPKLAIETAYFRATKQEGTVRIFVQGGSAAAGFPYGYGASLAGMLEQRLRRVFPDTPFEVISTAMSAVNTYTLLDFADEIIEQQPDAVLIYAGHNEYLGVLGVGSVLSSDLSPSLTRVTLGLRRLAVYQLLESLLGPAGTDMKATVEGAGRTLMARIARDKSIPLGSARYEQGLKQFRGNLARLLTKYRRASVPVIVGALASNERDLPPFVGDASESGDAQRFEDLLADGIAALDSGALDAAERHIDAAIAVDCNAADAWFARGRLLTIRDEHATARRAFLAAKDRDRLRFRAPEDFNAIVRELAGRLGARVADVQAALAGAAGDGIIGNEVMLEHVHPNLEGYFLLADAYFDALLEAGVLEQPEKMPSDAAARAEIPVSEIDRLFGEYKLQSVINDWPFVASKRSPQIPAPTNAVEILAQQMLRRQLSWPQATGRLMTLYREQGNILEETRVSLILADALRFSPRPQFLAGTALIRAGRAKEALRYLERAAAIVPDDVGTLLALGHALILTDRDELARDRLTRVLQLQPNNTTAISALKELNRRRSIERVER